MQVTNAAGAPVSGAAVALRLPDEGATGRFTNGQRAWVAYTDEGGIARFPAIQWGERAGPLEVKMTAAKGMSRTGLVVAQEVGAEHASVESTPGVAKPAVPSAPELALETQEPGTVSKPLADAISPDIPMTAISEPTMNVARSGSSAPSDKPHTLVPNPPAQDSKDGAAEPAVTITNSSSGAGGISHDSHKKLWILMAVGSGAAAGTLLALHGHGAGGGGSAGSSAGVSVGAPTITVGH